MSRGRPGVLLTALVVAVVASVPTTGRVPNAAAVTYAGSAARIALARPIEDVVPTASGRGYWLVASDGGIFAFGDARFLGSTGGMRLNRPIVGMAPTRTGRGYWLVASDGGVFAYGDARFGGSTGGMRLNRPIVGMAPTASGRGYWLVAADGGIFAYGDARFRGSTGGMRLNAAIVAMATTRSGNGYWLVASDGGIFAFGEARFRGSTGGIQLAAPIVDIAVPVRGTGYWLLARDGGIFSFGSAQFMGSAVGATAAQAAVGIAASPVGGYVVATQWGGVNVARNGRMAIDPNLLPRTREEAISIEMINRMNRERGARGLELMMQDPLLTQFARNWAARLAMTNSFFHSDLGVILRAANGRFAEVGENLFAGNGSAKDAGSAHLGLMMSPGHRANILLPEHHLVGVGAACVNGTLWVVENFAARAGTPLPPRGIPPLAPFIASDDDGASC
jgi:uncharacterized protein YkwD